MLSGNSAINSSGFSLKSVTPIVMNGENENLSRELKSTAEDADRQLAMIEEKARGLEDAASVALQPRIDRLKTMVAALNRDATEVDQSAGADADTARELAENVRKELSNLAIEVQTMSQGNPTTISAAIDKVGKAMSGVFPKSD